MPAMTSEDNEALAGSRGVVSSEAAERLLHRLKPRAQLALKQHQGVSWRQQDLHHRVHQESERHAPPDPEQGLDQQLRIGGKHPEGSSARAAGRPMAEPSAPIVRTRLRNKPPKRNTTKKQRRSHTISNEILQASRARPRPMVTPITPRIDPMSVAAVSSCVIRYMTIMTSSPCGIRWVKMGMVAARQASVSRNVALPRPGSAPARGAENRGERGRHRRPRAQVPLHRRYRRGADAKGVVGILHLDAHGKARRETDPVKGALDARQSIDAGAVLRQHRPTEPNDRAAEMLAGLRLQIEVHRRPRRDVTQLRLAEVGDDVPGARIHQREHLHTGPGESAIGDVHVDDKASERCTHLQ